MADRSVEALFQEQLRELRTEYTGELPAKIGEIEATWSKLLQHPSDEATFRTLHRMLHGLSGSGATFGLTALSDAARTLDHFLGAIIERGALPTADEQAQGGILLDVLKRACAEADQSSRIATMDEVAVAKQRPLREQSRRIIFLVEDDAHLAGDLASQLGNFGYPVQSFASLAGLQQALSQTLPAAIIVDTQVHSAGLAGAATIPEIQQVRDKGIPVVFVSDDGGLAARLQAVRAGADAYFTKPIAIGGLVDRLDKLSAQDISEPYRVLIVEDEPSLAAYYSLTLQQAGMTTAVITDSMQVMHSLSAFTPDLMLIDLYMPECTGLELAAVIRQQEAFVSVPIVFLSAETSLDKQLAAMRLGGDDFLTKPIQPDHLISAVTSRVQRSRILHSLMVRDSLTGLLNHTRIKEQLSVEVARAERQHSTLALAMIDIDHFKSVNDTYGHIAGDQVIKSLARLLQQRLRKTDVIGRYGGEEFAIVLPDTGGASAAKVLDHLRVDFAQIRQQAEGVEFLTTFSCGIATFPAYADAAAINRAADKALYEAKVGGRNRVVLADRDAARL